MFSMSESSEDLVFHCVAEEGLNCVVFAGVVGFWTLVPFVLGLLQDSFACVDISPKVAFFSL